MEFNFIIIIILFYCIGSIPVAYLLTRIMGYGDIRNIGSGNVGATNVLRTGKKSLAVFVLILDIIKGYAPISFLFFYFEYDLNIIIIFGIFPIIGHIFPVWLNFKGGKGVATYIGYIFGVDYLLGIIFISIWIFVALAKKYSSLGSIISLLLIPFISIFLLYSFLHVVILCFLSALIIFKHINNIKRLLDGNESKIVF